MDPNAQTNPDDITDEQIAANTAPVSEEKPDTETTGLPDEFTLEDLEGLTKAEQDAIMKAQDDDKAALAEAAKADEPAPEPEPEPVKQPDLAPKVNVDLDKAKADLDALAVERAKLAEDYDNGEVSQSDYDAKLDDIIDRTADAKASTKAAEIIDQSTQQASDEAWYGMVGSYMDQYPELRSDTHLQGFNASLIAVETAHPNMPDAEKVATAHRNYGAYAHSMGTALEQAPPAPGSKNKAPPADPGPGPRPDLPPTLAKTPAADINAQNDGAFANVDRAVESADVYAGEDAFSRMSPAQQEKYLREVG